MLEKLIKKGSKPVMRVSIVIPTYNRAELLNDTIESFDKLDFPKDQYEIIIANNNSPDNTEEVVKEWQQKATIPIKYHFEPRQGVHYARNSAAKLTSGEILYYTDDDMIADKDLLKHLVKVFDEFEDVGSATGRVLPIWEAAPPEWMRKYCFNGWLSLNNPKEDMIVAPYDVEVYSCHQAMRREAFFASGGFNPENTQGVWIGDGETGLNKKIKALGYKFAFMGKSLIYHRIPPGRLTQEYFNKRMANEGNCSSYADYKLHKFAPAQLKARMRNYRKRKWKEWLKYKIKQWIGRDTWHLSLGRVHYWQARIDYDRKLIEDASFRELVLRDNWFDEPMK